jgi:hypothetical protein
VDGEHRRHIEPTHQKSDVSVRKEVFVMPYERSIGSPVCAARFATSMQLDYEGAHTLNLGLCDTKRFSEAWRPLGQV